MSNLLKIYLDKPQLLVEMPSSCLHPPVNHMPARESDSLCIHSWSQKKNHAFSFEPNSK